jgi:hypothetical protein
MSGLREVGELAAEEEKLVRLAWMRREKTRCTGKTRQKKGLNSCEQVKKAGAVTMSSVELLNGTGTEGGNI